MKKIIIALMAIGISAGVVLAGEHSGKKGAVKKEYTEILSTLGLTTNQQAQIDAIQVNAREKGKGEGVMKNALAEIRAVLTEEQRAKFDADVKKSVADRKAAKAEKATTDK